MKIPLLLFVCCYFAAFGSCEDSKGRNDRITKLEKNMQEFAVHMDELLESMKELKNEIAELKIEEGKEFAITEISYQNDSSVEERVAVLEFQMAALTDDVVDIGEDLNLVEAEQIIQDQKILELQNDAEAFETSIEGLVANDVNLLVELNSVNVRVTDVNTTVGDLDVRVVELDGNLSALEDTVSQIDGRVSQMEASGTVAFQVDLDTYETVPIGSVVIFDVVELTLLPWHYEVFRNKNIRYNSSTGEFTVPSDGAGLYFFYVNFWSDNGENAILDIRVNGVYRCRAESDEAVGEPADNGTPSCGFVSRLVEGDIVDVYYSAGTDDTPFVSNIQAYNTFTGFRIAPE